jgi:hypothetical protein
VLLLLLLLLLVLVQPNHQLSCTSSNLQCSSRRLLLPLKVPQD